MPEHAYNCSTVSVLRSPHPRVTWILDEGLQHGEGPSRRLPSHIAAPDTISVRAYLQPGEAYGTRITTLRRRKFKAEFGIDALFEYYLPQYDLREQKHLPGLRFMWDEANKAVKAKKQKNPTKQTDDEHDRNARKFWFLVLGVGLFTKKTEADQHCDPDDVLIFFTKEQARRRWGAYCRKRHTHDDFDVPDSEEDDRKQGQQHRQPCTYAAPCAPSLRLHQAQQASITYRVCETVKTCQSLHTRQTPHLHETTRFRQARGRVGETGGEAGDAPSVHGRLTTHSGEGTHLGIHRVLAVSIAWALPRAVPNASAGNFTQCRCAPRTIALSAGAAPAHTSLPPNAAASASRAKSTARPTLHHFGGASSTGGSSASESSFARLLYNSSTRKIYKDAEKAVKEMGLEDTVQVVDCEDLVGYCAGKAGKMGK
ncbi:hypothetical protein B0H14DRAFT_3447061 [Mycena olivaceomarginata]|nr:hypothetical protein B0H14DRAFT_3447061 [Mycena olivaceomarginata]